MYVCMYVCYYVCMYVWMYVCMYVTMYVCMSVCMYVCMYIYIYSIYIYIIHTYICINLHKCEYVLQARTFLRIIAVYSLSESRFRSSHFTEDLMVIILEWEKSEQPYACSDIQSISILSPWHLKNHDFIWLSREDSRIFFQPWSFSFSKASCVTRQRGSGAEGLDLVLLAQGRSGDGHGSLQLL